MMLFRLMDSEAVIINEVVIKEVRSRECLWNPRNVCYKNKQYKYKAWEEVSVAVLPKYTTYSEDDKRRIMSAVQSRWKTARDAYMKCRLTVNKSMYKARQHRYIYNKLKFLERVQDKLEYIDESVNNRVEDDEQGSNSFVGDNSASQSTQSSSQTVEVCEHTQSPSQTVEVCEDTQSPSQTVEVCEDDLMTPMLTSPAHSSTVSDDDDSEGSYEVMDYDIDIHDDFKEKIKELGTTFDGVDDNAVNDNIDQECLARTSSQNNDPKDPSATADVNTTQKNCTTVATSALQTDDQLFFNSLAPFIDNFDIHQKLRLRAKIVEVVKEVRKIGPRKIKQERET